MKQFKLLKGGLFCLLFTVFVVGCSKNKTEEENADCKTCKAFAMGGMPEITMQVCSEAEEQAFRNEYAGREISCN